MRAVLFFGCAAMLLVNYVVVGLYAMLGLHGYGPSSLGNLAPLIMTFFEIGLTLGAIGCGYVLGLWNRSG